MTGNPFVKPVVTDVDLYQPVTTTDGRLAAVVVLERVEPGVTPVYCVHGRATCFRCGEWCWLGDETHKVVKARQATPLCIQCANATIPPGSVPSTQVRDHRRTEGPH